MPDHGKGHDAYFSSKFDSYLDQATGVLKNIPNLKTKDELERFEEIIFQAHFAPLLYTQYTAPLTKSQSAYKNGHMSIKFVLRISMNGLASYAQSALPRGTPFLHIQKVLKLKPADSLKKLTIASKQKT